MVRELIITADGSPTFFVPELHETYHSVYGAVQESRHVFINAGLLPLIGHHKEIRILEVGFGTGLNAWLTFGECNNTGSKICYEAIEAFPLNVLEYKALNYAAATGQADKHKIFLHLHEVACDKPITINNNFTLIKHHCRLESFTSNTKFDLIYFDAFAPEVQPELWTGEVFVKMYSLLEPGGILATYCSKSSVRKAMQHGGFKVEKIAGPPGKREMVRAWKEAIPNS